MDKVTVANFINLANNMVGSGLIPTGEANYELAKEYATQQSRIDAIRFLEWKTTNGWEYHINDVNEWLWYKEDKILTTDELYLLSINKK